MEISVGMLIPKHLSYQTRPLNSPQNVVSAKMMSLRRRSGLDYFKVEYMLFFTVDCNHVFCLECIRNWRYSHIGDPNVCIKHSTLNIGTKMSNLQSHIILRDSKQFPHI